MLFLLYKNRHVVVADMPDDTTDLEAPVTVKAYLGIHESIEGVARRGRPPVFRKPVPVADLSILSDVSDAHAETALMVFAANTTAQVPAEARTGVPPVATEAPTEEMADEELPQLFTSEEETLSEDDSFI